MKKEPTFNSNRPAGVDSTSWNSDFGSLTWYTVYMTYYARNTAVYVGTSQFKHLFKLSAYFISYLVQICIHRQILWRCCGRRMRCLRVSRSVRQYSLEFMHKVSHWKASTDHRCKTKLTVLGNNGIGVTGAISDYVGNSFVNIINHLNFWVYHDGF